MWCIYVIFHRGFDPSFLSNFRFENWKLLKTDGYYSINCTEQLENLKELGFEIIQESQMYFYNAKLQRDKYHGPSAIYHFYKNGLYKNLDYIGFMEYDLHLENDTSDFIEKNLTGSVSILLSSRHYLSFLLTQQDITINGKPCIPQIIDDYNIFFFTNHTIEKALEGNPIVGTQQSFICDKDTFERLGSFLTYLIEKRKDVYYPRPSTVFERYISIFFHFEKNRLYLSLKHSAIGYHTGYKQ